MGPKTGWAPRLDGPQDWMGPKTKERNINNFKQNDSRQNWHRKAVSSISVVSLVVPRKVSPVVAVVLHVVGFQTRLRQMNLRPAIKNATGHDYN